MHDHDLPDDTNLRRERDLLRETFAAHNERRRLGYSSRICPGCNEQTLVRRKRPMRMRFLRLVGDHRLRYQCASCGKEWYLTP
jgi:transposase-like protein